MISRVTCISYSNFIVLVNYLLFVLLIKSLQTYWDPGDYDGGKNAAR